MIQMGLREVQAQSLPDYKPLCSRVQQCMQSEDIQDVINFDADFADSLNEFLILEKIVLLSLLLNTALGTISKATLTRISLVLQSILGFYQYLGSRSQQEESQNAALLYELNVHSKVNPIETCDYIYKYLLAMLLEHRWLYDQLHSQVLSRVYERPLRSS